MPAHKAERRVAIMIEAGGWGEGIRVMALVATPAIPGPELAVVRVLVTGSAGRLRSRKRKGDQRPRRPKQGRPSGRPSHPLVARAAGDRSVGTIQHELESCVGSQSYSGWRE
jgi:hypothetical protein